MALECLGLILAPTWLPSTCPWAPWGLHGFPLGSRGAPLGIPWGSLGVPWGVQGNFLRFDENWTPNSEQMCLFAFACA